MKDNGYRWIPSKDSIEVEGFNIAGMVYYGGSLKDINFDLAEPSLILPMSDFSENNPEVVKGFWGSYRRMEPQKRLRYLKWLEDGRRNKNISIKYVFLFFYGLERRVVSDIFLSDDCFEELNEISMEILQLMKVYTKDALFDTRSSGLLRFINYLMASRASSDDVKQLCLSKIDKMIGLKFRLGSLGISRLPVNSDLAYEWLLKTADKNILNIIKSIPDQFKAIFEEEYSKFFGAGYILSADYESLICKYTTLNPCCNVERMVSIDVPTKIKEKEFTKNLNSLAFTVCCKADRVDIAFEDLNFGPRDYSKYRKKGSLSLCSFIEQLGSVQSFVKVKAFDLLSALFVSKVRRLVKIESELFVAELAKYNLAIEPDIRFSRQLISPDQTVILFPSVCLHEYRPDSHYKQASLLVEIVLEFGGLEEENIKRLLEFIGSNDSNFTSLPPHALDRLKGYSLFVSSNPTELQDLKRRVARISLQKKCSMFISCAELFLGKVSSERSLTDKLANLFDIDLYANARLLEKIHSQLTFNEPRKVVLDLNSTDKTSLKTRPLLLDKYMARDETSSLGLFVYSILELNYFYVDILNLMLEKQQMAVTEASRLCRRFGINFTHAMAEINQSSVKILGKFIIRIIDDILLIDSEMVYSEQLLESNNQMASYPEANQPLINNFTIPASGKGSTQPQAAVCEEPKGDVGRWIPQGQEVVVAGVRLPGMIYVGSELRCVDTNWKGEPALIDPLAPVAKNHSDHAGVSMHYWPSYRDIEPRARLAYLNWLANGRVDPTVCIGYVFLFLYGLERRALHDTIHDIAARADLLSIAAEVERLLAVYGTQQSFKRYASSFIVHLRCLIEKDADLRDTFFTKDEVPDCAIELLLGLGRLAYKKTPVPANWAYAWLMMAPKSRLRTKIKNYAKEFKELFLCRYREMFDDGLIVSGNTPSIIHTYRASSASFACERVVQTYFPDVTFLKNHQEQLDTLARSVVAELDGYSRYINKYFQYKESLGAAALLPAELVQERLANVIHEFIDWINSLGRLSATPTVEASQLLVKFYRGTPRRLAKNETDGIIKILEIIGVGMEPDIRFHVNPLNTGQRVFLFPLRPDAPSLPVGDCSGDPQVTPCQRMCLNGQVPHENQHEECDFVLTYAERHRLRAYVKFLLENPQSVKGVNKRFQDTPPEVRQSIAYFCVAEVCASAQISVAEIEILQTIFKALGQEESLLYSRVHGLAIGQEHNEIKTVHIPEASGRHLAGEGLDYARIARKIQQTESVAEYLEGVFVDNIEDLEQDKSLAQKQGEHASILLPGLDRAHSCLLERLLRQSSWKRPDYEEVAKELGLMPDGAIEAINEAAFAEFDAAIIDAADDSLLIDVTLMENFIHVTQPDSD